MNYKEYYNINGNRLKIFIELSKGKSIMKNNRLNVFVQLSKGKSFYSNDFS